MLISINDICAAIKQVREILLVNIVLSVLLETLQHNIEEEENLLN